MLYLPLDGNAYLTSSNKKKSSDQKCAKVTVMGVHVNFGAISIRIMVRSQRDDVTSLQVEHPTSVQTTCPLTTCWRLHHRDWFVVNLNKDSSIVVVVNLSVDVVPSWGRNFQFSVLVRHTTCKIAVRSTDRPILDHYETNYEHISVKL